MKAVKLFAVSLLALCASVTFAAGKDYTYQPVSVKNIKVNGGFWQQKMNVAVENTVPHNFQQCELTGRIKNFAVAAGLEQGQHEGAGFNDSDLAKIIEGAAYSLAIKPDPKLEAYVDGIIAKIIAAQEPDGYLYTKAQRGDLAERWVALGGSHEMYNVGHMMEAAVAYHEITGKRSLLDAMIKNADLICKTFNEEGIHQPDSHEEIELALVRLYRATGDEKYLNQSKFLMDQRGRKGRKNANGSSDLYGTYAQDHKPVIEQDQAVGHAVRGAYLYCGMADVAAVLGDKDYLKAVDKIWENVVGKQMYVNGSIGSSWALGEAFGGDYDLPNLTGYSETCGAIANAMWNYRMFLLHGDGKYMDVFERAAYNGFLSSVALDGKSYCYTNPLGSLRGTARIPFHPCACCPSNTARFLPGMPGYAYAVNGSSIYVNLFMHSESDIKTAAGTVKIKQETNYPWDGDIKMMVDPAKPGKFALRIRIPGWAQNRPVPSKLYTYIDKNNEPVTLKVNGEPVALTLDKNYAVIDRDWKAGDKVELGLPMPVRRVVCDPKCKWNVGRVVLERGPVVYCLEGVDVPNERVFSLMVSDNAVLTPEYRADFLGGMTVLTGKVHEAHRKADGKSIDKKEVSITAIPSMGYGNRGRSPMIIWLAREETAVLPVPAPTVATKATMSASQGRGVLSSFCDQIIPNGFGLDATPSLTWWPRNNALEWVQYDFAQEAKVSKAKVYWFDDRPYGGVRVPLSWKVLYKAGDKWVPVKNRQPYSLDRDKLVTVNFDPVKTTAVRFEIQSTENHSSGAYELTVE